MIDIIHIEPTNKCDLACSCCGDHKTRKQGYMAPSEFVLVMVELKKLNPKAAIRLFLSGDPLKHPRIAEFVRVAGRFGFDDLVIHTSGFNLTEERAQELIGVGLPKISFSVDTYHKQRNDKHAYSWNIIQNVKMWLALNERSSRQVHTTIQHLTPEGVPGKVPTLFTDNFARAHEFVIKRPHQWDVAGSVKGARKGDYKLPCKFTQRRAAIYWNGDAVTCCADLNGRHILGNVLKGDSLETIVRRVTEIGRLMVVGAELPKASPCRTCERFLNVGGRNA